MIKNYLKIAWRNLSKNKFSTCITVIGLTAGLAFSLLIIAHVWIDFNINKDLKNADNQYIIQSKWKSPEMGMELTSVAALPEVLKEQYPNLVANYYRFDGITSTVSKGDKHFREQLQIGDPTFITMYGFPLLHGNANSVFVNPFTVVISKQKALTYFGKTDVIGESLSIDNFSGEKHDFLITGVLDDFQQNSVTSVNTTNNNEFFFAENSAHFFGRNIKGWNNLSIVTYIELKNGVTAKDLEAPIALLIKTHMASETANNYKPYLVPLKEYYLESNNASNRKTIYSLSVIAFFILLISIVNAVNISVARASGRTREIGVRKVMGSAKKQLIIQFITESVLLSSISTLFALLLYQAIKPYFEEIIGKTVPDIYNFPLPYYAIPLLFAFIVGVLTGIYPAFVLSSLRITDALKGKPAIIKDHSVMRKALLGLQFTVILVVTTASIIITKQISLFFSKDLGYDKELIITLPVPRDWTEKGTQHMLTVRDELSRIPNVTNVSLSYAIPNGNSGGFSNLYRADLEPKPLTAERLEVDNNFIATYNIPLIAGSFFSSNDPGQHVVLNEAQAKAMGWQNVSDAVGKKVNIDGNENLYTISGIVGDFCFSSMKESIKPTIFLNIKHQHYYRYLSFRITADNTNTTLGAIKDSWNRLVPGAAFEYRFMDDNLKKLYQSEIQFKKAAYTAAGLSFTLILIGLLGLVSISMQRKVKEIGIRKILGASIKDIITLFLKEFTTVTIISVIISCPLSYFIMNKWLNDYAYKIAITPQPFIISVLVLSMIVIAVISLQTLKTAGVNPIKNLRTE